MQTARSEVKGYYWDEGKLWRLVSSETFADFFAKIPPNKKGIVVQLKKNSLYVCNIIKKERFSIFSINSYPLQCLHVTS